MGTKAQSDITTQVYADTAKWVYISRFNCNLLLIGFQMIDGDETPK